MCVLPRAGPRPGRRTHLRVIWWLDVFCPRPFSPSTVEGAHGYGHRTMCFAARRASAREEDLGGGGWMSCPRPFPSTVEGVTRLRGHGAALTSGGREKPRPARGYQRTPWPRDPPVHGPRPEPVDGRRKNVGSKGPDSGGHLGATRSMLARTLPPVGGCVSPEFVIRSGSGPSKTPGVGRILADRNVNSPGTVHHQGPSSEKGFLAPPKIAPQKDIRSSSRASRPATLTAAQ